MKRVRLETEPGPLLTLLLALNDKQLRLHLLSYCYLSINALARTCKAFAELLLPIEKKLPKHWWRYGIDQRLRLVLRNAAWPAKVTAVFCERFDPFYCAWPEDIPARVVANHKQALGWLWSGILMDVASPRRRRLFETDDWIVRIRDDVHDHYWCWEWTPDTETWCIKHGWLAGDPDDWRPLAGSLQHASTATKEEPDTWFSVRYASSASQAMETFWIDRRVVAEADCQDFPERVAQRFRGYCSPSGALAGAHTWQ
jgi:hypothetical protein